MVGDPVSHSLSPQIHHQFAKQCGKSLRYEKVRVARGEFQHALTAFARVGGRGMNVTVPFKADAFACMQQTTPRANRAGAVNTIRIDDDFSTFGDNTDGEGLIRDLTNNHGVTLDGQRVLLIGAGGAARGVVGPLLDAGVAEIRVLNRTAQRAHELVNVFADERLTSAALDSRADFGADVIINATSSGLSDTRPDVDHAWLKPTSFCYDMLYGAALSSFLHWAKDARVEGYSDGLGMLVEQAAAAFSIWWDVYPDTKALLSELRRAPK